MACKRSGVRIPIAPLPSSQALIRTDAISYPRSPARIFDACSDVGEHVSAGQRDGYGSAAGARRPLAVQASCPRRTVASEQVKSGYRKCDDGREQPGEQDGSAVNAGRQLSGAATAATRCGEPDAEAGLMSSIGFGDDVNWIVEGTNGCLEMHPDHLATAVRECGRHMREILAVGGWPRQRIGRGRRAVGRRPFPHTQFVRSRA